MTKPLSLKFPLFVLDTETCGLPSDPNADVVEVGAVYVDRHGAVAAHFSSLVYSHHVWSGLAGVKESMQVHGITARRISKAPKAKFVDFALSTWMQMSDPVASWTSWRMDFDQLMLARTFPMLALRQTAPCIWMTARQVLGDSWDDERAPRLKDVSRMLNLGNADPNHRALDDAKLAADAAWFIELTRRNQLTTKEPN